MSREHDVNVYGPLLPSVQSPDILLIGTELDAVLILVEKSLCRSLLGSEAEDVAGDATFIPHGEEPAYSAPTVGDIVGVVTIVHRPNSIKLFKVKLRGDGLNSALCPSR
jgi:hypothetical protein